MDTNTLIIGILSGAIGSGYFIYGRKQQHSMSMICGVGLCLYPYFISNLFFLIIVGIILLAIPFFFNF